jgi:hypothetical protein
MATTQVIYSVDLIKGRLSSGPLSVWRVTVGVSGVYATGAKPVWNFANALAAMHMGPITVAVKSVTALLDYNDGTNQYTASNANIALTTVNAGSTNDQVTFRVDSGASNGDGTGAEIGAVAINGAFVFLVNAIVTMTGQS